MLKVFKKTGEKTTKYILIALCLISLSLWYLILQGVDNDLRFYALNVGQADALLFKLPKNQEVLVDTGRDKRVLSALGATMPLFDRRIELLILTHQDSDHIGGAEKLLDDYTIDEIWFNGWEDKTAVAQKLRQKIAEKNILTKIVKAGDEKKFINAQNKKELLIKVIYPLDFNSAAASDNNQSVITKFAYENNKFLLTGDCELECEKKMLAANIDLSADILKVAHHGSKNSSSREFLERVKPKIAVISVGKNSYGHPTEEVLERLKSLNIQTYRTDTDKTREFFHILRQQ